MRSRIVPRGIELTELGFGAAQLGNLFRATSDEEARRAVDAAWDLGVRYFDTAPHYGLGLSESRLGDALSRYPRTEFALSTKVGKSLIPTPENAAAGMLDDQGFIVPASYRRRWDFSRDGILRSIDESLTRLNVDYVDIAYLHDPDDHWDEASTSGIDALIELREQRVVRAIGAGMNQSAMLARFVRECPVDVVMVAGRYTLLDRSALDDLLPLALTRGVGVIAAGVYNSGLLSRAEVPDDAKFDYQRASTSLIERARNLARTANDFSVSLPDLAVQFALRHPAVASVVVGLRSADQVRQTMTRMSTAIPEDLWSLVEEAK